MYKQRYWGVWCIFHKQNNLYSITQKKPNKNYFVNFKVDRNALTLVLTSADWFRLKLDIF